MEPTAHLPQCLRDRRRLHDFYRQPKPFPDLHGPDRPRRKSCRGRNEKTKPVTFVTLCTASRLIDESLKPAIPTMRLPRRAFLKTAGCLTIGFCLTESFIAKARAAASPGSLGQPGPLPGDLRENPRIDSWLQVLED